MRRLILLGVAVIGALAATGVAVGNHRDRSTSSVSATFSATSVNAHKSATCTSEDGTFQITSATYTGQSTGDATLTGPIRLAVRSAINTSDKLGVVDGIVTVERSGRDTKARLTGVYKDGNVSGFLTGMAFDPGQRLLGTFSAGFSSNGGFANGSIGGGSLTAAALRESGGSCKTQPTPTPTKGNLKLVGGTVSALSSSSITISLGSGGSFTCSLDDRANREISHRDIEVGDQVSATCAFKDGAWRLDRIKKR